MWNCNVILTGFLTLSLNLIIFHNVSANESQPSVSFVTINKYSKSTTDFDEVDDTRNFISEALFSESQQRLGRHLTKEEKKGIVRTKNQFETFNNLRFNDNNSFIIDLSCKFKDINDAQITSFYKPNQFNDVNVLEYGTAIQYTSDINEYSFLLRGDYKRVNREGIIEHMPSSDEDINQFEINALISKPFGDENYEKIAFYATYVFQDIHLNIPNQNNRDRDILAILFTYGKQGINVGFEDETGPVSTIEHIFARKFDTRGLKFFSGITLDIETYENIDVTKTDFFIGTSLNEWIEGWNYSIIPFDITTELDIFTSNVEGDPSQDNTQFRTNIISYYQISRPLVFILPLRHDIALEGPSYFNNLKAGMEFRYFWLNERCYASISYGHQVFFNVDKDLDIFEVNFSFTF